MADLDKLSKTLDGYQNTRENFAHAKTGKYFAYIRNTVWFCYFLPLLVGVGLLVLQPTCAITKSPVSVTGCQFFNVDMNPIITFYANTHIYGLISVALGLLVIKALFMIKFINVEIVPK